MKDKILLGFEVGSGKEVYVEPSHVIVTGITQRSGKTTALEALAKRSLCPVLFFTTKLGELTFAEGNYVQPFFKEHADWQFVESLLEATMKEKMRFERSWIIRATKGAKTLKDVDANIQHLLKASREGSLQYSVYTNLHAYFEIVLPEIERQPLTSTPPTLNQQRINIMDLTNMTDEMESLVIRSTLEHILTKEKNTIVVLSELWKFAPEGRGNPVKQPLEALIRQGAARGNFVWIDSQDLAGVDKAPLKQVSTWILGLQLERNEVQHTLDQIPLPKKEKPSADRIMTLKLGHFILATPEAVKHVYVQPSWLDESTAKNIALGKLKPEDVASTMPSIREFDSSEFEAFIRSPPREFAQRVAQMIAGIIKPPSEPTDRIEKLEAKVQEINEQIDSLTKAMTDRYTELVQELRQRKSAFPRSMPKEIDLEHKELIVNLTHVDKPIQLTTDSSNGKVLFCAIKDLPKGEFTEKEASEALAERGWHIPHSTLAPILSNMVKHGYLIPVKTKPQKYRLPTKLTIKV